MAARHAPVFGVLGLLLFLATGCSRGRPHAAAPAETAEGHEGHEHAADRVTPPTLDEIAAAAGRLGDLGAAARLSRVRLTGAIEFPATNGRLPIEETGIWPDRYEMRLRDSAGGAPTLALNGVGLRLSLPAGWPGSFRPDERFARQRLRSLFILRHVAAALVGGGRLVETHHPTGGSVALATRDGYGEFGLVWGGVRGGMLAIEEGPTFVHFPAFFRTGPWFLPAMQSYESDGALVAVLYVTSVETEGDQ